MRGKQILAAILLVLAFSGAFAYTGEEPATSDSLRHNLQLLKRYLSHGSRWHFTDPLLESRLRGLEQFIESEPVDTLIETISRLQEAEKPALVTRRPEEVPDSLSVPGYVSHARLVRILSNLEAEAGQEARNNPAEVPREKINQAVRKLELVPEGMGMQLFKAGIYRMPDSLKILEAVPEQMVQTPADFRRILYLDSIRSSLAEKRRIQYNDSLIRRAAERATREYRDSLTDRRILTLKNQKIASVKRNNQELLKSYNNQVMAMVNDSLLQTVRWLAGFADRIDNTTVSLVNLTGSSSPLLLSNSGSYFTRIWLKNEQNDSLAVLVQNLGKRSMRLAIEDGVTFSRFRQQSVKDFDFATLNRLPENLDHVARRYQAYTPWTIGGDGTLGFTQTYLSNWKKGGKSALSILVVAKGYANFSSDKVKWENSGEIRNGWIKPGDEMIQKNDDKLELTSRVGLSAFQKWYYSAEADFETQFFDGFKYPDRSRPISGFLAPGRFLFKVGLDYKPNKDFSLFISPLTSKTVFVSDTNRVDKGSFGIRPGRSSYWEPGLNTDIRFRKELTSAIVFETKFRMFFNYLAPFRQTDLDWENLLTIQLTDHINLRMMTHSIYDSKVLFDKVDKNGEPLFGPGGEKLRGPKLQFREFVTVGFSYRINRRVVRTREITGAATQR